MKFSKDMKDFVDKIGEKIKKELNFKSYNIEEAGKISTFVFGTGSFLMGKGNQDGEYNLTFIDESGEYSDFYTFHLTFYSPVIKKGEGYIELGANFDKGGKKGILTYVPLGKISLEDERAAFAEIISLIKNYIKQTLY